MIDPSRLALGCANIGNDYGPAPVMRYEDAERLIRTAVDCGIRIFDTAAAYGKSEKWLDRALVGYVPTEECTVITKVYPGEKVGIKWSSYVLGHDGRLPKAAKPGQKRGISVYDIGTGIQSLRDPDVEAIQVPLNIFQAGFLTSGVIQQSVAFGRFVTVRSVLARGELAGDAQQSIMWAQIVAPGAVVVVGADTPAQIEEWFA